MARSSSSSSRPAEWSLATTAAVSILILLFLDASTLTDAKSLHLQKRSVADCSESTVCGWYIYEPRSRTPEYFIKSRCECGVGASCTRHSDDLSISAYVYRCTPDQVAEEPAPTRSSGPETARVRRDAA